MPSRSSASWAIKRLIVLGIEPAFDHLYPFVEHLLGVAGEHRHLFLGQDRAFIYGLRGQVHGRAGDLDAGGQRVANGMPAFERRQ